MHIVIFSNGSFDNPELDRQRIRPDAMTIAADGGLEHCLALDLTPDLLVGDLDSVELQIVERLRRAGSEIQEHPQRKDYTDLELALESAVQHTPEEILILGGLGGRWDQTLTNILLLSQPRFRGPRVLLAEGLQQIELIFGGSNLNISANPGATVSLVPIKGPATGITTQGLEYELAEGTLEYGSSQGVSNVMVGQHASVTLKEGILACVLIDADYESLEI